MGSIPLEPIPAMPMALPSTFTEEAPKETLQEEVGKITAYQGLAYTGRVR